jgi:hypothetical protein
METIIGFSFFASATSRQMISDATELPPGELILNTMAFVFLSFAAFRIASESVSEPMV